MLERYLFVPSLILLTSCSEIGPSIDFGTSEKEDTTYITSPELPQPKNILIEEFTGVSCPPCPSGHDVVKAIKTQHSGRIIVIAYHIFNFPQAHPVDGLSKQDFRTQESTDIGNSVYGGIGAMPLAGINRVPINNERLQGKAFWPSSVSGEITKSSAINLNLTNTFDDVNNEVTVRVKVSFTGEVSQKLSLNLALIEDSIIDAQKNQLEIDTFYTHNYVLRDLVTSVSGSSFLDDIVVKEQGRVYERTFKFSIQESWVADKLKIVCFVHSNEQGNQEVHQAAIAPLIK
jgi:hypothetical protein